MKKLLSLLALSMCISASIASTNTKPNHNSNNLSEQNSQKKKIQKQNKYDFSLFKFITPANQNSESDSLKHENDNPPKVKEDFREETTVLYESPRCFLMFS